MYLTFSFWILMFSCARRVACSKILRCCCRSAAAAAGSAVVLGFSLCFLLRSRCYCCSLLSFSLSTLSLSHAALSVMLPSRVHYLYVWESQYCPFNLFLVKYGFFQSLTAGKNQQISLSSPFWLPVTIQLFGHFLQKKNSGSTAVNTHILSGSLSLAALSVLLPSHVYNFYVWVCESPRTACCVCTYVCVCV